MRDRWLIPLFLTAAVVTQTGCNWLAPVVPQPSSLEQPKAFAGVTWDHTVTNGLSDPERKGYYFMDEGIQYLPADMLMALRRPLSQSAGLTLGVYKEPFFDRAERFGLYENPWNAKGPPLGITESTDPDYVPMAGINCATCHTSVMQHTAGNGQKTAFILDGGSSLFSVNAFFPELVASLVSTVLNPAIFDEFYAKYRKRSQARARCEPDRCDTAECQEFGFMCTAKHAPSIESAPGEEERNLMYMEQERSSEEHHKFVADAQAHFETTAFLKDAEDYRKHLEATLVREGVTPAAVKHNAWKTSLGDGAYPTAEEVNTKFEVWVYLLKRIIHFANTAAYAGSGGTPNGLGRSNPWEVTKNMLAANGKALSVLGIGLTTNASSSDFPQAASAGINTPHIWGFDQQRWIFWTGVTNSMVERNLAQGIALLTDFNWETWETTISIKQIHAMMGKYTVKIEPPAWPEQIFGAADKARAERGKQVFRQQCYGCHSQVVVDKGPGGTLDPYRQGDTDPWYFRGQITPFANLDLFSEVLGRWLGKVKVKAYQDDVCKAGEPLEGCLTRERKLYETGREDVVWKGPQTNAFVAKPLYGIWATAPYLHNGTVPSIRDLLTPSEQRPRSFFVGDLEYDAARLGFRSPAAAETVDRNGPAPPPSIYYATALQVKLTGNGNLGHEYGTCLPAEDKDALIEFLKTYRRETSFEGMPAPGAPTCCGASSCSN